MAPIATVTSCKVTEDVITRVALLLSFDQDVSYIRNILLTEGLSEHDIFLAVKAGELYSSTLT